MPKLPERGAARLSVRAPLFRSSPHVWVPSTYFAEGFPYTLVNSIAEVIFKEAGATLGVIGLTSLLHLPWNLKFLWAPLLDRYETKRSFLCVMQLVCAAALVALAFVVEVPGFLVAIWILFALLALASATNDIAIDGYYMEALDAAGQSKFVGYRASAYKLSSLFIKGGLPVLAGAVGWRWGLLAMATVLFGIGLLHSWILPQAERRREHWQAGLARLLRLRWLVTAAACAAVVLVARWLSALPLVHRLHADLRTHAPFFQKITASGWIGIALLVSLLALIGSARRLSARLAASDSAYARGLMQFATRPGAGRLISFVVLFRTGEALLGKMKWPFLSDHVGISLEEYGIANGVVGVLASFAATFWGGHRIARDGLERWFWPFLLAQNVLNLLYVLLAAVPQSGVAAATAVIAIEEFGSGLGTAVFVVLLMRACDAEYKATHFALLTAVMSVSFTVAGAVSGFLAQAFGYAGFFAFSFLATFPMMFLAGPTLRALRPREST